MQRTRYPLCVSKPLKPLRSNRRSTLFLPFRPVRKILVLQHTSGHGLRGMCKSIRVYAFDANPAIDPPLFFASRNDAAIRVDRGFALYLAPKAIQLKPPPGWTTDRTGLIPAGSFSDAWKPKLSAYWLVWQMTSCL